MIQDAVSRLKELFLYKQEAERTLADPGLKRALEDLRTSALQVFAESSPSQREYRDNAYWMIRALDGIEAALKKRIQDYTDEKAMQADAEAREATVARALRRQNPERT